jgi:hypothetical protein
MENVFELSFVGSPSGLRQYLESQTPNCDICKDEGFFMKDEWTGTDTSYEVAVRCECSLD